jgi:cardiolipin synthase
MRRKKWVMAALVVGVLGVGVGVRSHFNSQLDERSFRLRGAVPAASEEFDLALYQSLGVRLRAGHHVSLLQNGKVFDGLVEQIGRARSSVHLLMYIWEKGQASDRIVAALVKSAKAGVRCRILVDDVGSPDFAESVAPALTAADCSVRIFRPLPAGKRLARNHRKLLIVDGTAAVTGGFGIRDNWLGDGSRSGSWRDTNVSFSGPSVTDAQQAFAENWQEAGGELLPANAFPAQDASGPASAAFITSTEGVVTRSERLMQLMIASAKRRIWIANAYFVPSRGVLELLERKARAGVEIRLLAPDKNSDSKSAFGAQHMEYGSLLELGVRVWEYTASMMHAKTMLVDDDLLLVGSINLDPLSLNELEEVALLTRDAALARELGDSFVTDCRRSNELKK